MGRVGCERGEGRVIRFPRVEKPEGFAARVEERGARWLAVHPDAKRPHDYWSEFRPALATGFRNLCAYSAMLDLNGEVDHFVSWNENRSMAYEWANYRYATGWINSCKSALASIEILDPHEVQDGWFEVSLPSLQLELSTAVPETHRARARRCLDRLRLGHDERIMRQRRAWYAQYQAGKLSLEGLADWAPLIAAAVRKQQAGGRSQAASRSPTRSG